MGAYEQMTVLVGYGDDRDKDQAERVSTAIENRSDFTAYASKVTAVNWDNFQGVVLVGGSEVNEAYGSAMERTNLEDSSQSNYIVVDSVELEGTPVLGISGWTEENTENAVDQVLGDGTLNTFLGTSNDDRDEMDGGDQDEPDYGDGTPRGQRITLGYSGITGIADPIFQQTADQVKNIINNSPFQSRTGYTINEIDVREADNEVDFYVQEVGSVTLLTAGLILAGLLTANVLGLSWFFKNAEEEETDQQIIEEKSDTKEALKQIIESEEADEEAKESARETLIDIGADVGDDTGDNGGSQGSQLPFGLKKFDVLVIGAGILLLDEFLGSGKGKARTIIYGD